MTLFETVESKHIMFRTNIINLQMLSIQVRVHKSENVSKRYEISDYTGEFITDNFISFWDALEFTCDSDVNPYK